MTRFGPIRPDTARRCLELAAEPVPPMDEKTFDAELVKLAKRNGWLTYHTRDSRKSERGFPDRVFVRERVVWAELKRDGEDLAPDQQTWFDRLTLAQAEVYVWRPAMWSLIEEILK